MVTATPVAIAREFSRYMTKHGDRHYSEWYVGITNNAERRLFDEHAVDSNRNPWIYQYAATSDDARSIEAYFLDLGCQGGSGGGDDTSNIVYAYKVAANTVE